MKYEGKEMGIQKYMKRRSQSTTGKDHNLGQIENGDVDDLSLPASVYLGFELKISGLAVYLLTAPLEEAPPCCIEDPPPLRCPPKEGEDEAAFH